MCYNTAKTSLFYAKGYYTYYLCNLFISKVIADDLVCLMSVLVDKTEDHQNYEFIQREKWVNQISGPKKASQKYKNIKQYTNMSSRVVPSGYMPVRSWMEHRYSGFFISDIIMVTVSKRKTEVGCYVFQKKRTNNYFVVARMWSQWWNMLISASLELETWSYNCLCCKDKYTWIKVTLCAGPLVSDKRLSQDPILSETVSQVFWWANC